MPFDLSNRLAASPFCGGLSNRDDYRSWPNNDTGTCHSTALRTHETLTRRIDEHIWWFEVKTSRLSMQNGIITLTLLLISAAITIVGIGVIPFLSSEAVGKVAAVLGVFVGLLTGIRSSFGINDKLGFYQTMADQFRSLSISIEFVQQADEAVFQQFAAKFLELREAAIRGTPRGQDIPSSPSPGT